MESTEELSIAHYQCHQLTIEWIGMKPKSTSTQSCLFLIEGWIKIKLRAIVEHVKQIRRSLVTYQRLRMHTVEISSSSLAEYKKLIEKNIESCRRSCQLLVKLRYSTIIYHSQSDNIFDSEITLFGRKGMNGMPFDSPNFAAIDWWINKQIGHLQLHFTLLSDVLPTDARVPKW